METYHNSDGFLSGKARKISTAMLVYLREKTFHKLQLKGHQWQLALQLFYEAWKKNAGMCLGCCSVFFFCFGKHGKTVGFGKMAKQRHKVTPPENSDMPWKLMVGRWNFHSKWLLCQGRSFIFRGGGRGVHSLVWFFVHTVDGKHLALPNMHETL